MLFRDLQEFGRLWHRAPIARAPRPNPVEAAFLALGITFVVHGAFVAFETQEGLLIGCGGGFG